MMRSLNVAQAKAQLSALLDAVEAGEEVEITRRGIPWPG
ncbi:type II toxin-antitoxin system Phd/YefM family antitoxin [Synechococcus sp. CS-1328]|nr:type II toxin-antitoxin system prevent-host-death family antitoxin [Synechococcus sp. CS-1328]